MAVACVPVGIPVYTIGHSGHPIETFIELLQMHRITAVADVRSQPYSRFHPQFNKRELSSALGENGISYAFLGRELGARPKDQSCRVNGRVCFARVAALSQFRSGLERVIQCCEDYRVVLMCAEKEPLDCHRTILVSRHLKRLGMGIRHILADGSVEDHSDAERRLLSATGSDIDIDMIDGDLLERAYEIRQLTVADRNQGE